MVDGSLMVTIPKEIAAIEGIQEGEIVKVNLQKIKKDWFSAAKGVGGKLKRDEKVDIHG